MKRPVLSLLLLITLSTGCSTSHHHPLQLAYRDDLHHAERLIKTGRRQQAIDELSMLLELDPKNEPARFLRALAYQGLAEFSLAIQDYQQLLSRNNKHSKSHFNLGMIYAFQLKNPQKALYYFDQFLTLQPNHSKTYQVAKIMASLDKNSLHDQEEIYTMIESAHNALKMSDKKQRQRILQQKSIGELATLFIQGKIYEQEGNDKKAIQWYQKSVELSPTCSPCHQALGKLLLQEGDKKIGNIHLRKAELFRISPTMS